MGVPLTGVRLIAPLLRGRTVLCFGYPDLLLSPEQAFAEWKVRVPGRSTNAGYGLAFPLADTRAFFGGLGAVRTHVVDIFEDKDVDALCDLNRPHPKLAGRFGIVIDPGTMEHCANVGQALMTAAGSVAPGGAVLHISPLSMINHGFWGMSPTLFRDFYEQNGWDVRYLGAFRAYAPYSDVPWSRGFDWQRIPVENNLALLCLVERGARAAQRLEWPTQARWKKK